MEATLFAHLAVCISRFEAAGSGAADLDLLCDAAKEHDMMTPATAGLCACQRYAYSNFIEIVMVGGRASASVFAALIITGAGVFTAAPLYPPASTYLNNKAQRDSIAEK